MSFDDSGIRYELKYWIDDARRYPEISDVVRTNIWYELDRRGIPFSYPTRIVEMRSRPETEPDDQVSALAARSAIVCRHGGRADPSAS